MRFEVLGSLRATHGGQDLTPPGRVQRLLLATLLLHSNQRVGPDTLIEAIWPDEAVTRTAANLQVAVHRLRGRLDAPTRLARDNGGYRLRVAEDEYDVAEFYARATRLLMHDMPPDQTTDVAREALGLWRGPAFVDVPELRSDPEVSLCEERQRWVFEVWCEAELTRGRPAALIGELTAQAAAEPLYEKFAVLLMRALHASGRTADALAVYERTRVALRDQLGVDPGRELRDEQMRVLASERPDETGPEAAAPAQLPPSIELVGRDEALATIGAPERVRLAVVSGTAGVGKTAIALAWAHRHAAAYPDGQIFIDLRGFSDDPPLDPAAALEIGLRSLGVPTERVPPGKVERSALLRSLVSARRVLLVLDNARSSEQVRPLLPGSESCTTVVTSRDVLSGLVAREGATVVELHPLAGGAATELLTSLIGERATAEPDALHDLALLCGELPLALRVVAQQVRTRRDQSLSDVVGEVVDGRDRLDLLDAGDGAATDLRAVLSWSYESLNDGPARALRLIGLLPGEDADVPALAALCGATRRETRRWVDTLVKAHLVERTEAGRVRQHDLLRAYAGELARDLDSATERAEARSRLLRFYARSATAAIAVSRPDGQYNRPEPVEGSGEPLSFAGVSEAQAWLERERRNVLAAVESADRADSDAVFAVVREFSDHLRSNGHFADGVRMHSCELDLSRLVGSSLAEHTALCGLGNCYANAGDLDDAERAYAEAAQLDERVGDRARRAAAVGNLGTIAAARGNLARAEKCFQEAVGILRELGPPYAVAIGLYCLGKCSLRADDADAARRWFEESLRMCDEEDLPFHRIDVLVGLADAAIELGDPQQSERLAGQAERLARELHVPVTETAALASRGRACVELGRPVDGRALLHEATARARAHGDMEETMDVLAKYVIATAQQDVTVAMHRGAVQFAQEHGFAGYEAGLHRSLADVRLREGDADRAVEELTQAATIYASVDDPRAAEATARGQEVSKSAAVC